MLKNKNNKDKINNNNNKNKNNIYKKPFFKKKGNKEINTTNVDN